ncbi:MAG: O-antigen ligase family protein [Bacteroidales bacterium]|nr:O-antigen ligase family protein [Bacteroidales bacterium]
MGDLFNLLAFAVLNIMLIIALFRYCSRAADPLNRNKDVFLEGPEAFLVLLLATSTLALSAGAGGRGAGSGLNLQSIRLLFLELFLTLSFFVAKRPPRLGIGIIAYMVYMVWITISLLYTPNLNYGIRYLLKYLYPLLIMLACSAIVREEKVFLIVCIWMRRIALISTLFTIFPLVRIPLVSGLFWYSTALNMHYVVVACASFMMFFNYGHDWKDLAIGILFFLPCILSVHRIGLLCIFGGSAIFFFYKFQWASLPWIAGVVAIALFIIFNNSHWHDKMFWKDTDNSITLSTLQSGAITDEDIRDNGRKTLWSNLEQQFYDGHELTGSGIGSCQWYLYTFYAGVKQTHGDYVQMRCDTGLIGMWLYLACGIAVMLHCLVVAFGKRAPNHVKSCAIVAAGAVAGHYFSMYADNCVTYTMATTGVSFAFYGMMLGMKSKTEETTNKAVAKDAHLILSEIAS